MALYGVLLMWNAFEVELYEDKVRQILALTSFSEPILPVTDRLLHICLVLLL